MIKKKQVDFKKKEEEKAKPLRKIQFKNNNRFLNYVVDKFKL